MNSPSKCKGPTELHLLLHASSKLVAAILDVYVTSETEVSINMWSFSSEITQIQHRMFLLCELTLTFCNVDLASVEDGMHFKCGSCIGSASSGSVALGSEHKATLPFEETLIVFPPTVQEIFDLLWSL